MMNFNVILQLRIIGENTFKDSAVGAEILALTISVYILKFRF
jgi:hypothetical protein